ncbi:hypothetical protein F5050DRAFT_1305019 [Lentinula boryana]|uniref:Homeobox domain-containing protein n=1 Tax=Lentinula boryana TaxID=40481 RepID=A0ABQ8QHX9_9AGAR|nr:hypothetical protein F5050DRAFT_1305019 [Lentinula boryana]
MEPVCLSRIKANNPSKSKRLTLRGARILHAAFQAGMRRPTLEEKKLLWERIVAIPHCEHYQLRRIDHWFCRHRNLEYKNQPAVSMSTLYPIINFLGFKKFCTLFEALLEPSEEVVMLWAKLLGALVEDVAGWIAHQRSVSSHKEQDIFAYFSPYPSHMQGGDSAASPSPTFQDSGMCPSEICWGLNKLSNKTGLSIDDADPTGSFPGQSFIQPEPLLMSTMSIMSTSKPLHMTGPPRKQEPPLAFVLEDLHETSTSPSEPRASKVTSVLPLNSDTGSTTLSSPPDERQKEPELPSFLWAPSIKHLLA